MNTKRHLSCLLVLALASILAASCSSDELYEEATEETVSIQVDISNDKPATRAPGDAVLSVNRILILPFRKTNESLADDAANFAPEYASARQLDVSSFPVITTKLNLTSGSTYRIMVIGYNKNDYDFTNQSANSRRFDLGSTDNTLNGFYLKPVNPTDVPEFFTCVSNGYMSSSLVGPSFRPEQVNQIQGVLKRIVSGLTLEVNQIPGLVKSIALSAERLITETRATDGTPLVWQEAGDNGNKSIGSLVPVSGKVVFNIYLLATTQTRPTLFYLDVAYGSFTESYTLKVQDKAGVASGNRISFTPNNWVKVAGSYANINLGFVVTDVINLDDNAWDGLAPGTFVVTFFSNSAQSRAPVSGLDGRVRHLRYIIYKSTGEYVKEKVIVETTAPTPSWPLSAVTDTLPKGSYTAVFVGNVEKTLFPYTSSGATTYADVLTNYKTTFADARIVLPNAAFTDNSEYYWAKVNFSDTSAQPNVLLQRIISMLNLHRNFVDGQTALNALVNNIVTQLNYKNYIQTTVNGLLPGLLRGVMDLGPVGNLAYNVVGGLDNAVNAFVAPLVLPITNALYDLLLQNLTNQIGSALGGNANQAGAVARLGILLNPWGPATADAAIVTLRDFPKTMDFNLSVKDVYSGDHAFVYKFMTESVFNEKDVLIRGFNGVFNVRKIQVAGPGIVGGLLFDQIIDGSLLLNGAFVNITDPIQATVATNFRYKSNYSFLDLGLKSYAQQTDDAHKLSLSVKIGDIANINGILTGVPVLGPLLGGVLSGILTPIKNITITVPVNLPLLGVENLSLSGGWSAPTTY